MDTVSHLRGTTVSRMANMSSSIKGALSSGHNEAFGVQGFDELRKLIKQGNEFCREIGDVIHDRCELEVSYAKSLQRISAKLSKVVSSSSGTLADAWGLAATEMDQEAELRKQMSVSIVDDVVKPLKTLADNQYKTRKPLEAQVDKTYKNYTEKLNDSNKHKLRAFQTAKDREKLAEQHSAGRDNKGKAFTDKESAKLGKQVLKLDDTLRKVDKEYQDVCKTAEQARQEWDASVYKSNGQLQFLEEERVHHMQDILNKYNAILSGIPAKVTMSCNKLSEGIMAVDSNADIRRVVEHIGRYPHQPEQTLPDFYAEDLENIMKVDRRRELLRNYLIYVQADVDKEERGREGVEKLVDVYRDKPAFADAGAQEDVKQKLVSVTATLNYLEAVRYKLSETMSKVDQTAAPSSRLSSHIQRNRDKSGMMTSILKMPASMTNQSSHNRVVEGRPGSPQASENDRTGSIRSAHLSVSSASSVKLRPPPARPTISMIQPQDRRSGYNVESPTDNDEDFSEFYEDVDPSHATPLCRCRAIYAYEAKQQDELSIQAGDMVTIYDKQDDGWWFGMSESSNRSGVFPGSYVEEA